VAGLLIGHGADVNAPDAQGWRRCTGAANNNMDAIKALIAQGADVHAPNGEAKTPLSLATEKNHREAVALLRRRRLESEKFYLLTFVRSSLTRPDRLQRPVAWLAGRRLADLVDDVRRPVTSPNTLCLSSSQGVATRV
jgi:ankyrin repeat protein